jgi:bzd-type benzoyl-CoA reductase N subunit
MDSMKALEELIQLSSTPLNSAVTDYKRQGKKVIGFFCSYIPEEIISAAGMLPVRIRPTGCTETVTADAYMSGLNCTLARSCLEFISTGVFDFLDGLIFANSCDNIRRIYDVLREKRPYPFMHFLSIPHKASGNGPMQWYSEEVTRFKEAVEDAFGIEISDGALNEAIAIHNESRSLLRRLNELRREEKPPITGAESLSVVLAATTTPKDKYNQLLRTLLEELQGREEISSYRARLMIVGSEYDDPAYSRIVEDLGGLVVTDALCFGSKYFAEPVRTEKDTLIGLAKSYLDRPSCPRMSDRVIERADFIGEMIERYRVDGVIFQHIRYCDLWGGEAIYVGKRLKDLRIPWLSLEREYRLGGIGQLKTRIQAFLERIEIERG